MKCDPNMKPCSVISRLAPNRWFRLTSRLSNAYEYCARCSKSGLHELISLAGFGPVQIPEHRAAIIPASSLHKGSGPIRYVRLGPSDCLFASVLMPLHYLMVSILTYQTFYGLIAGWEFSTDWSTPCLFAYSSMLILVPFLDIFFLQLVSCLLLLPEYWE